MTLSRGQLSFCALAALALSAPFAAAGEVVADPVCRSRTSCYDPCAPCRVGPVRRFFRRVFRPCCPPPCPPRAVVVLPPAPPAAPMWMPPPAASIERPFAPLPPAAPPPVTIPGTGSRLRREGVLTPPVAPPPVRVDRMANWSK